MAGDSNNEPMYGIVNGQLVKIPPSINFEPDVKTEEKEKTIEPIKYNIPDEQIESLIEKACRYDRIANSIMKQDYKINNIKSENFNADTPTADLIWKMVVFIMDGLEDYSPPFAIDYLDHYLTQEP